MALLFINYLEADDGDAQARASLIKPLN